jgi:hypothetical protein
MSCCTTESCIVISSIVVEEVAVSGEGGAVVVMVSSILFVRVSTAALRAMRRWSQEVEMGMRVVR